MLFDMASAQLEPSWVKANTDIYLASVSPITQAGRVSPLHARYAGFGFYSHENQIHLARILPGPFAQYLMTMRRFYPELDDNMGVIYFEDIEAAVMSEQKAIKASLKGAEEHKRAGFTIRNLLWDKLPPAFANLPALEKKAAKEHEILLEIRHRITEDQQAKHKFLTNLFPKT